MELINSINDALKKVTTTEIIIASDTITNKSIGSLVPIQRPKESENEVALVTRQQLATREDNKFANSEQTGKFISTQAQITPEVQTTSLSLAHQMDPLFEIKAATSWLNVSFPVK